MSEIPTTTVSLCPLIKSATIADTEYRRMSAISLNAKIVEPIM